MTWVFDHDLLFRLGQAVGFVTPFRFQEIAIFPERRVIQHCLRGGFVQGVPFQIEEDEALARFGVQVLHPRHQRLPVGIGRVGGEVQESEGLEPAEQIVNAFQRFVGGVVIGGGHAGQLAAETGGEFINQPFDALNIGIQLGVISAPIKAGTTTQTTCSAPVWRC